jgi:hypothetical protein
MRVSTPRHATRHRHTNPRPPVGGQCWSRRRRIKRTSARPRSHHHDMQGRRVRCIVGLARQAATLARMGAPVPRGRAGTGEHGRRLHSTKEDARRQHRSRSAEAAAICLSPRRGPITRGVIYREPRGRAFSRAMQAPVLVLRTSGARGLPPPPPPPTPPPLSVRLARADGQARLSPRVCV